MRSPTRTTPVAIPSAARFSTVVGRREEPRREVVGDDAVDLLGHATVEAPEPGLHVGDGDAGLRPDQRTGESGVRVAVHEDGVRPCGVDHPLERKEHPPDLLDPAPAADPQAVVGRAQVELREEGPRERRVPVLARVDEDHVVARAERRRQGRGLDELRTRADDVEDPHGWRPGRSARRGQAAYGAATRSAAGTPAP